MSRLILGGVALAAGFAVVMLLPLGRGNPDVPLTLLSAVILAASIIPLATRLHGSGWQRFGVWFALLFLNLASVAIEGTLFAPGKDPPSQLAGNLLRLAVASAAAAVVAARVSPRPYADWPPAASRPWFGWVWRVSLAAGVYLVAYFVIGGLNYTLVTHPYYESHAGSLALPPTQTIFAYEPFRGVLIALSVAPLITLLRIRLPYVAFAAGALLFVVGGLVPLLPQTSLPLFLRIASLWEIFAQNMLTGIACGYLFRPFREASKEGLYGYLCG